MIHPTIIKKYFSVIKSIGITQILVNICKMKKQKASRDIVNIF